MSINDFLNKIKGKYTIDVTTLVCLCVIILVGVGSFGLGRLSVSSTQNNDKNIKIEGESVNSYTKEREEIIPSTIDTITNTKERMYVASKNGKMYYTLSCAGAKRIKPENEVWFATTTEAEKAGYKLSSTCK